MNDSTYEINLPLFKGPFDLLLFFIERDELDIYDIPIAKITDDFLAYLHHLEKKNIEVASEFILVAATLMRIKAKMLLPRQELDEFGNEIDPREELVKHLLEYKKYKSVIDELSKLEDERSKMNSRGNVVKELQKLSNTNDVEAEIQHLDLYKILKVYQKVLQRHAINSDNRSHEVVQYPYTIEEKKDHILNLLEEQEKISFEQLILEDPNKISTIYNFLSILELIQLGSIIILIGDGYNNFWIEST